MTRSNMKSSHLVFIGGVVLIIFGQSGAAGLGVLLILISIFVLE